VLAGILDRLRAAVGGRVLVVGDEAAIGDVLREALRAGGYAVETAPDAGTALDVLWAAWDDQPDVLLLDLRGPAVGGRGFAALYRELPVRHAPIVLRSGPRHAEEAAAEAGAAAVLRKPVELDDLLEAVARCARATR
jgi:two-component system, OmpR family, KDP operon response regulator KdpE